MPRSEIVVLYDNLFFDFLGHFIMLSIVTAPVCILSVVCVCVLELCDD